MRIKDGGLTVEVWLCEARLGLAWLGPDPCKLQVINFSSPAGLLIGSFVL